MSKEMKFTVFCIENYKAYKKFYNISPLDSKKK